MYLDENKILSPREKQVLELLWEGYACKQIARELGISTSSVTSYSYSIYSKFNVEGRVGALRKGLELGILEVPVKRDDSWRLVACVS